MAPPRTTARPGTAPVRRRRRHPTGGLRARMSLLVAVLALVAAACSLPLTEESQRDDPSPSSTDTTTPGPLGPEPTEPRPVPTLPPLDPAVAETLAGLPGRLAIGAGPLVALVNPDGSNGVIVGGGDGVIATQPTWSTTGALLAWSEITPSAPAVTVFDPASGGSLRSDLDGAPPFYLQWNTSEQLIALLRNDPDDGIEAAALRPGEAPVRFDAGGPHFLHWAPERDFWISHVADDRLSFVSSDEVIDLPEPLRAFSTPQWVDGDRFVFAGPAGLVLYDLDVAPSLVRELPPGPVPFTIDPTGARVALLAPPAPDAPAALEVVDLVSGRVDVVTTEAVVAWEWSPDGERLAWTGLDRADAANLAQLHVWDVAAGAEVSTTPPFRPTELVVGAYYPFFTQYAVSHHTWAPDGSAFVFAGTVDGDDGIFVHVVEPGVDGTRVDAARVAVGDVAFWSPNDVSNDEAAPDPF